MRALSPVSIARRARRVEGRDRGRGLGAQLVADRDLPRALAVALDEHERCAPRPAGAAAAGLEPPESMNPGRPSRSSRPSTGRQPTPGDPDLDGRRRGTSGAAGQDACASGCSLRRSSAAASASTLPVGAVALTVSMTSGRLRVRVPVLSSATVRTRASASRAAPPLISAPERVAAPIAATTVTGTEMANAHGAAATSTTSERSIQAAGRPSSAAEHAIATASTQTPGTSGRAIRSASRWPRPLRSCASSTIRTIWASELSSVREVTSTSSAAPPLIAAA